MKDTFKWSLVSFNALVFLCHFDFFLFFYWFVLSLLHPSRISSMGLGTMLSSLASCLHPLNSIFDPVKAIVPDSLLQSFFIVSLSIVLCLWQSPSFSSIELFLIVFPLWTHRMLKLIRKAFLNIWFDHTCSKQLRLVLKCISWLQQNIHCCLLEKCGF